MYESELSPIHSGKDHNDSNESHQSVLFSKSNGGLVKPFNANDSTGLRLDVRNVTYSVNIKGKDKILLRSINMRLEPGEMCALMGSSGAGKSTLLDLIADRKLIGKWSGEIMIDRRRRSLYFNRESAYVLQDDAHIATLTVEETLIYAAWFRMVEGTTKRQVQERVEYLLETIGLSHVRGSIVGDALNKGISGGQLKRLSIAVEIVALPGLIFLDEPTSGLDSSIALEVMAAVRKLTDQGRTVVSTIHQPSPEVYGLFHKVVLLSAGRLIFCGTAEDAVKHFTQPDMGYTLIKDQNPAEFIINVCGGEVFPEGLSAPRLPEDLETLYTRSQYYQCPADPSEFRGVPPPSIVYDRRHATSKFTAFKIIMARSWLNLCRDRTSIVAQVAKNVVVGVVVGIVFYGQGDIHQPFYIYYVPVAAVQNVNALLFFAMLYCLLTNSTAIDFLCGMNTIYRRELASFAYACSPYWLAQCIVSFPFLAVFHMLFMILVYFIVKLPPQAFMFSSLIYFLANLVSYYAAMFLAAFTGNSQAALSIFPDVSIFLTMFSGFPIALGNVPVMWKWATYVSPARWIYQSVAINEWEIYDASDDNTYGTGNGLQVLEDLSFNNFDKSNTVWIVGAIIGGIMVLTYISMRPKTSWLKYLGADTDSPATASAPTAAGAVSAAPQSNLKQSLLTPPGPSQGSSLRPSAVETLPAEFGRRSTFDVDYYRTATGRVRESKGCRLVFRDLSYSVPDPVDKKKKKMLLSGVSGRVHPGEMCALMGASGAGKSTLLDVLAGRKTTGEIKGDILFNGVDRTPAIMLQSAYVMQDNVHIGSLTVRETLMYAAHLRLPQTLTQEKKDKRVKKIADMLGLGEHCDTLVGDENTRGISGGQLKRLSIGVEIVNLPDLIFLDEPTTGLDSAISYDVMAAVRNLANQNRTVLCTIHQPSQRTFALFDKLLLLAGGKVIYFGPSKDIVTYFCTSIYQFPYTPGSNPADYLIAVAGSFQPDASGKKVSGEELAAYYARGDMCRIFLENLDRNIATDVSEAGKNMTIAPSIDQTPRYPTTTSYQLYTLCHRVFTKTIKDPSLVLLALGKHVAMGLFWGTLYYQLPGGTDASSYTNRLSLVFFCQMFVVGWHQQNIPALFNSRLMFYRERGAKLYGALPYWISSFYLDIPIETIFVLIFSIIIYYMTGLNDASGHFLTFYGNLLLVSWTGLFFAQMIAALCPTSMVAIASYPIALFINLTFAGYIIYLPSFPEYLSSWGPYITFMRFSFQTLVLNELQDNPDLPYAQSYIDGLGFDTMSKSQTLPIIVVFLVVYGLAVLLSLKFVSYENR